jgi:hypothetical protein
MTLQQKQELFDEVLAIVERDMAKGLVTTYGERLRSLMTANTGRSPNWVTLWDALKAARRAVG